MKRTLLYLIVLLLLGCGGQKVAVRTAADRGVLDRLRLEIVSVDVSSFPEIEMRGIVKDAAGFRVKDLAPPYAHLEDWQQIWVPLLQEHPTFGPREFADLRVVETRREIFSTGALSELSEEESLIEVKISELDEQKRTFQTSLERQTAKERSILSQKSDFLQEIERQRTLHKQKRVKPQNTMDPNKGWQQELSIVLVMDVSGSMRGEPLAKTKAAALKFLESVDAEVAIVVFDDRVHKKTAFTRDRMKLTTAATELTYSGGGGTHLYNALYEAINMLKGLKGEKHIIALTDGQTKGDSYSLEQIISFANSGEVGIVAQTDNSTKLFTVGMSFKDWHLERLAHETGGEHFYIDSPAKLDSVFTNYLNQHAFGSSSLINKLRRELAAIDLELAQIQKEKLTFNVQVTRLEKRLAELDLDLQRVEKRRKRVLDSVVKEYVYQISFESIFGTEDGSTIDVSFKFGDQTIRKAVTIPISDTQYRVQGVVIDEISLMPIPGAQITVNSQMSRKSVVTRADETGHFAVSLPKTYEIYSIFAEADEYFISTDERRLADPDRYYVNIDLRLKRAEKGVTSVMRTVHFENNEFLFEPQSFADLVVMGQYLSNHPEFSLEVAGHTDSFGNDSYNQWLSEKRAEVVAEFFASLGVPEENLEVGGYGESRPLVADTSAENRYLNRRVEITLLEIGSNVVAK